MSIIKTVLDQPADGGSALAKGFECTNLHGIAQIAVSNSAIRVRFVFDDPARTPLLVSISVDGTDAEF